MRAFTAALPGARGGGVRHDVHEREEVVMGRTLEVVYPFAVQYTYSDFDSSLATSEKVDKVSDFWGSGGLLLHDEVYILDAYTELLE